jgi:hypothetical protein
VIRALVLLALGATSVRQEVRANMRCSSDPATHREFNCDGIADGSASASATADVVQPGGVAPDGGSIGPAQVESDGGTMSITYE